jgi:hypothetical protein
MDDRHGNTSTLIMSQLPTDQWYQSIGDNTLADAILDRLMHNAHRIKLKGESMRKMQSELTDGEHLRGVAIFAKDFSGLPARKISKKLRDRQCLRLPRFVKQRGKMARESGKTALKTVHPDMCHDPVFCRRNLGCYLWILLPKSEDVIL